MLYISLENYNSLERYNENAKDKRFMEYIPWIIAGLSLLIAFLSYLHTLDRDTNNDHKEETDKIDNLMAGMLEANLTLKQVNITVSDIKADLKLMDKRINDIDKDLAIVKRDIKTAFNKIDDINKRLGEE